MGAQPGEGCEDVAGKTLASPFSFCTLEIRASFSETSLGLRRLARGDCFAVFFYSMFQHLLLWGLVSVSLIRLAEVIVSFTLFTEWNLHVSDSSVRVTPSLHWRLKRQTNTNKITTTVKRTKGRFNLPHSLSAGGFCEGMLGRHHRGSGDTRLGSGSWVWLAAVRAAACEATESPQSCHHQG